MEFSRKLQAFGLIGLRVPAQGEMGKEGRGIRGKELTWVKGEQEVSRNRGKGKEGKRGKGNRKVGGQG